MAFTSASTLPNVASSTADLLPSLSTLTAPLRALGIGRRIWPKQSPTAVAPVGVTRTEPQDHTSAQEGLQPDTLRSVTRNPLGIIPLGRIRFEPSAQALAADHTLQGVLIAGGVTRHESRPLTLSLKSSVSTSRNFSTQSLFATSLFRTLANRNSALKQQTRFASSINNTAREQLARLELTANNNPSSASSQNAFYSALLRAGMPEILVERYETGRYATNGACDALYTRALERVGESSMEGATGGGQAVLSTQQQQAIGRAVAAQSKLNTAATVRASGAGSGSRTGPLHVVVDEPRGHYWFKWVKFFLIYGATIYFAAVIMTFLVEASGLFRRVGGPQNAEIKPEQQKTRFSDVKGCDEAIEELQEIVDFLKSPNKYNKLGGKLPKGVLMIGPPGTGKTLLARAVAGEAGVPFFYMSGSEFDEVYVGVGAKRVRELFANAKAKAPAIVFIDELDAVGGKRNERDAAYHMQTLNQMLTELDGFDQSSGVVFIAATNFPQMLDKALTRPGRFDRQVIVPLPDVRGRMDILKYHMRNMHLSTDVDSSVMARGTPGFSGADLENLVNQAAVHASKNGATKVTMKDLDWARDRIMMGAERKSAVIQEKDKLMTAYHEAGHALVALFTGGADPLYKVTILPRGQALGITSSMPEMDKVSVSKKEARARIDVSMGGKAAEALIYGEDNVTSGCSSDLTNATNVAWAMVTEYGMSETLGNIAFDDRTYTTLSGDTRKSVEAEVRRLLDESQQRTMLLLRSKRKELDLLAKGLMKYETMTKEEVEKVIRGEALPDDKLPLRPGVVLKIPELPLAAAKITPSPTPPTDPTPPTEPIAAGS